MQLTAKYKIFIKSYQIIDRFPLKINRFHRTKWKRFLSKNRYLIRFLNFHPYLKYKKFKIFKKLIKNFKKKKKNFVNKQKKLKYIYSVRNKLSQYRFYTLSSKRRLKRKRKNNRKTFKRYKTRYQFKNFFFKTVKRDKKKIINMKTYAKESLHTKTLLLQLFDNSIKFKDLKKNILNLKKFHYVDIIKILLSKPLFFLNIFLWKLNFFSTTREANSYITRKLVLVNNTSVSSNYCLKVGDIITFNNISDIKFNLIFKKFQTRPKFYSFVEVDFYSGTIIIVKNFTDFTHDDFTLFMSSLLKINQLCHQIK